MSEKEVVKKNKRKEETKVCDVVDTRNKEESDRDIAWFWIVEIFSSIFNVCVSDKFFVMYFFIALFVCFASFNVYFFDFLPVHIID